MILVTKTSLYLYMYVCMYVYLSNCTQPRNPALSSESFYATRTDPPKGGSMILVTVCMHVCMYVVCMYVFIKLHLTTQSGPVILVILCHSH